MESQHRTTPGHGGQLTDATRMPPPASRPRKRKEIVLEEDDWAAKLEAIVERDFFPELGKLQDKVQWLEAVRSGDMEQIRQAQLGIARRRAGASTATPATGVPLFTPGGTVARLGGPTPHLPPGIPADLEGASDEEGANVPNVSLDTFLATHTSEDNASFHDILERTNKRRRERAQALLGPSASSSGQQLLLEDGKERTDGFGTTGHKPDTLVSWKYNPINMLMYDGATRESLPHSDRERAAMAHGPPKGINHSATRFTRPPAPGAETPSTDGDSTGAATPATLGGSDSQALPQQRSKTGQYDIMATPSFEPGVDASPFMTWGEIEATPVRIEAEDLPPGALDAGGASGPSFRINELRRREQKGHDLATSAAARQRQRATVRGSTTVVSAALAAVAGARRQAAGGSASRGRTPLSEAAQRLASSVHKGKQGADVDAALRASYHRTPTGHRGGGRTGWSSVAATPVRGDWTPATSRATPVQGPLAAQQEGPLQAARQAALDAAGKL